MKSPWLSSLPSRGWAPCCRGAGWPRGASVPPVAGLGGPAARAGGTPRHRRPGVGARWGEAPHFTRALPLAQGHPRGSGGLLPPAAFSGGAPGVCAAAALAPPPLFLKLGTQSSDASDADLPRLNSLRGWIFFILDSRGKTADCVSLSPEENCGTPSAMQGGSTVEPWRGEPG